MFGTQIAICFALWLGFGYLVFRNVQGSNLLGHLVRGKKIALATFILVGSGVSLLASLMGLQSAGAIVNGALTPIAWCGAGVVGSVFVGLQVLAIELLLGIVSETVTTTVPASSDGKEGNTE